MGGLIMDAIVYLLQHFLDGFTTLMTTWMVDLQKMGITEARSPFIVSTSHVMEGIAISLLGLYWAWTGIHQYILWSESAPDMGVGVWKPALMSTIGIAAGSAFTIGVFRFGLDLAGSIAGINVYQHGLTATRVLMGLLTTDFSGIEVLVMVLVYLITIVILLIVVVLAGVRAAELAFYTAAAPLFALGLVKKDMGIFKGFLQKLIILSVSQAVVIFAVKAGNAAIANMGTTMASVATAPLIYLGFLWVALKGPSLLEGMMYKSGGSDFIMMPIKNSFNSMVGGGSRGGSSGGGGAKTAGGGKS